MKKVLWSVAAALVATIAVVLGIATTKPDSFEVERQIVIAAPPAVIFANLEDFKRWESWSPWEKLEPGMKKTFSGPASGVGASYAWQGKEVGAGKMTVTDSTPNQKLTIQLDFTKPFEAANVVHFDLTPASAATRVSWRMNGPMPFASKVMAVFADMDSLIGKDFDKGLAQLKSVSESPAAAAAAAATR